MVASRRGVTVSLLRWCVRTFSGAVRCGLSAVRCGLSAAWIAGFVRTSCGVHSDLTIFRHRSFSAKLLQCFFRWYLVPRSLCTACSLSHDPGAAPGRSGYTRVRKYQRSFLNQLLCSLSSHYAWTRSTQRTPLLLHPQQLYAR